MPPPKPQTTKKNQKPLAKLLSLAVAHATRLSLALFLAALVAPLALPLLERKLDFEESGPLPGSARPNIRTAPGAEARFEAATRAAERLLLLDGTTTTTTTSTFFFEGLARELEARGLEVARLTQWRADWPYGRQRGRECAALHAVLRSPRGDGKESVAIVTPLALQPQPRSLAGQTREDAALALAAAHALVAGHLRDAAPWLAKDIVWILPDASCGGTEALGAWLAAYHQEAGEEEQEEEEGRRGANGNGGDGSSTLKRRPFVRAGVIQQALVLQFESLPSPAMHDRDADPASTPHPPLPLTVALALVGGDGQLPKTDFYWLARYYCSKWVRLPGCAPPGFPADPPDGKASSEDGLLLRAVAKVASASVGLGGGGSGDAAAVAARAYVRRLGLVLRFAGQQARGVPTGPHAPFKWRNTDAITITFSGGGGEGGGGGGGQQQQQQQQRRQRSRQAAELLELSVRSCSVLVERLHHAFFLYALSSPDHFVSVERYIGPACALIGVLVLQAAAARQALLAGRVGGSKGSSSSSSSSSTASSPWAASARVAVLLPLLCGALGWSLRAGLEAASLGGSGGVVGASSSQSLSVLVERAVAAAARRLSIGAGRVIVDDQDAAAFGPGYAAAEALRLGSLALGLAVLGWAGLAEGFLVFGGRRGGKSSSNSNKRASSAPALPLDWRMLKVLMLCGAAVPLAGMACANWALAHAVALACAPLAFAAPSSSSSGGGKGAGGVSRCLRIAAVVLCSPPGLAALAVVLAGGGLLDAGRAAASVGDAARWLVLEGTSWATWSFAWCVYAPLWVASAWIVSLPG